MANKKAPAECGACHGTIGSIFYDCYIPQMGMWGDVCHACFKQYKCKLGVGLGQKYDAKTGAKVAG